MRVLGFGAVLCSLVLAADGHGAKGAIDLDGRWGVVRVYGDPERPDVYDAIPGQFDGANIFLDVADLPNEALLVFSSADQTDALVLERMALGMQAHHHAADSGNETIDFHVNDLDDDATLRLLVSGLDGLDLTGARARLVCRSYPSRGDRLLAVFEDFEVVGGVAEMPGISRSAGPMQWYAQVSHPEHGQFEVRLHAKSGGVGARIPVPGGASELRDGALFARVTDPEGKPVVGARVNLRHIRTLGEGLLYSREPELASVTNEDGRFSMHPIPRGFDESDFRSNAIDHGKKVPPRSRYHITVKPPRGSDLVGGEYSLEAGAERELLLERGRRHLFVFADADGMHLDPTSFSHIGMTLRGGAGSPFERVRLAETAYLEGAVLSRGTLAASGLMMNTEQDDHIDLEFNEIEIGPGSPETLVFQLPAATTLEGRVVDGATGAPIPGAFVTTSLQGKGELLATLTGEQWAALRKLPHASALADPVLEGTFNPPTLRGLVRADSDGRYRLPLQAGHRAYGVIAFAEGYIGRQTRLQGSWEKAPIQWELPDARLFPAARVTASVVQGGRSIMPNWRVEDLGDALTQELAEAGGNCCNDSGFEWGDYRNPNQPFTFQVPADVPVTITLDMPYHPRWDPWTYPEAVVLAKGQTLALGDIKMVARQRVSAVVLDEAGAPLEGMPVRINRGTHWSVVENSDVHGRVWFYVSDSGESKLGVSYSGLGLERPDENTYSVVEVPIRTSDIGSDPNATSGIVSVDGGSQFTISHELAAASKPRAGEPRLVIPAGVLAQVRERK
jgi:hypothetical protein